MPTIGDVYQARALLGNFIQRETEELLSTLTVLSPKNAETALKIIAKHQEQISSVTKLFNDIFSQLDAESLNGYINKNVLSGTLSEPAAKKLNKFLAFIQTD